MSPTLAFALCSRCSRWLALPAVSPAQHERGESRNRRCERRASASTLSARRRARPPARVARSDRRVRAVGACTAASCDDVQPRLLRASTRHHTRASKLFARALDEDRVQTPGELSEEARSQAVRYLAEAEQTLARVAIELETTLRSRWMAVALEVVTSIAAHALRGHARFRPARASRRSDLPPARRPGPPRFRRSSSGTTDVPPSTNSSRANRRSSR